MRFRLGILKEFRWGSSICAESQFILWEIFAKTKHVQVQKKKKQRKVYVVDL